MEGGVDNLQLVFIRFENRFYISISRHDVFLIIFSNALQYNLRFYFILFYLIEVFEVFLRLERSFGV